MALSAPQPDGDILGPADILGHLLVIVPTEFMANVPTKFDKPGKDSPDAIRVDVAVLTQQDETGQPPIYRGVLWFNVMLVRTLKRQIGESVLARMAQGKGTPGQSPPFVLEDAMGDPQAVAFAEQFLANTPAFEAVAQRSAAASLPTPVAEPARPAAVALPGGVANAQVPVPAAPVATPAAAAAPAGPVPLPGAVAAAPVAQAGGQADMAAVLAGMTPAEQAAYVNSLIAGQAAPAAQ